MWVRRTFISRPPMEMVRTSKEEGGMLRQYIPGRLSDNPALTKVDPNYEARLEGLGDPVLVRAMLEGDWSIAAGAMYANVWRESRHVIPPFPIPVDWPIWVGADDGYSAPAAVEFLTENPKTKTVYCIGEVYKEGLLPKELAERTINVRDSILRVDHRDEITKNTDSIRGFMDSAAFADTGQTGPNGEKSVPRGNQLVTMGLRLKPAPK